MTPDVGDDGQEASSGRKQRRRQPRAPAPLTKERLRSSALWYLERFAGTRAAVKRFLDRRLRRAGDAGDPAVAEAPAWIEAVLDDLSRLGLINDRQVAESLARGSLNRGESQRRALSRMAEKGIDSDTARAGLDAALAERGEADPDRSAALRLAARKRLGPYRPEDKREHYRDRDLRTFARQGFSAAIAYWIVDAESKDLLEDEIAGE